MEASLVAFCMCFPSQSLDSRSFQSFRNPQARCVFLAFLRVSSLLRHGLCGCSECVVARRVNLALSWEHAFLFRLSVGNL